LGPKPNDQNRKQEIPDFVQTVLECQTRRSMLELSFERLGLLNVGGAGAPINASSSCAASQTLLQQATVQAATLVQLQAENRALQSELYKLQIQEQAHTVAAQRRS
jgi:hypothetical protein